MNSLYQSLKSELYDSYCYHVKKKKHFYCIQHQTYIVLSEFSTDDGKLLKFMTRIYKAAILNAKISTYVSPK